MLCPHLSLPGFYDVPIAIARATGHLTQFKYFDTRLARSACETLNVLQRV